MAESRDFALTFHAINPEDVASRHSSAWLPPLYNKVHGFKMRLKYAIFTARVADLDESERIDLDQRRISHKRVQVLPSIFLDRISGWPPAELRAVVSVARYYPANGAP